MKKTRHIGILCSGGDCPGLNAVIRAVVRSSLRQGLRVTGFQDGYAGLVEDQGRRLGYEDVADILAQGGTILGASNKDSPFAYFGKSSRPRDRSGDALATAKRRGLDGLIVLGGDGSLKMAEGLSKLGLGIVGVPKTIDNDIFGTDRSFGFDTAVATASESIDRLRSVASSLHRVMVVEVMGRYTGWLALYSGVATGADVILIPEIPFQIPTICRSIDARRKRGRKSSIIVVAEGAPVFKGRRVVQSRSPNAVDPVRLGGVGAVVAKAIEAGAGVEARSVTLGHVVRGGSPTAFDRVLATRFGLAAARLVVKGDFGKMVALKGNAIEEVPLAVPGAGYRAIPRQDPMIGVAREIGCSFGDVLEAD
ncbi:MAG: ATP-dependent 6-phosphofructokinase [candidate division FCPU426 bacterium]